MSSLRRGRSVSAVVLCSALVCLAAVMAPAIGWSGVAMDPEDGVSATYLKDVPLFLKSSYGPGNLGAVVAGKGTADTRGSGTLSLNIPGTPVAAFLYIDGKDLPGAGKHFPTGDKQVRVRVSNASGAKVFNVVPVAYRGGSTFVSRLNISRHVVQGANTIAVSRYDLNFPKGIVAVAVYDAGVSAERKRIDLFEGADEGYYPHLPPRGPDSEVVLSTFDPYDGGARQGKFTLALAGTQPNRGDEILMYTGPGNPAAVLLDRDKDKRPDILDRRYRMTLKDPKGLANDKLDAAGHREALLGAISLEEDKLGVARSQKGFSRGAQMDIFSTTYAIPADHAFSAFQVQSENTENGDSFTLLLAINEIPMPEGFNPAPDIIVSKSGVGACVPGDGMSRVATYTFQVQWAPGANENIKDVHLTDDPALDMLALLSGDDGDGILEQNEIWLYEGTKTYDADGTYVDTVTVTGTGVESGAPVQAQDDASVTLDCAQPGLKLTKDADKTVVNPDETVTYTIVVTNTGEYALTGVVVEDDVLGPLGTIPILGVGDSAAVTYTVPHTAPSCGAPQTQEEECLGGNVIELCSQTNTATASTGSLFAWDKACVDIKKKGTIIVRKETVNADGSFDFTSQTLTPASFTLTTSGHVASRTFANLAAGTYDVAEAAQTLPWEMLSASCDDGSPVSAISLQAGETVTCTFVNKKKKELCYEERSEQCNLDPGTPVGTLDSTVNPDGSVTVILKWYRNLVDNSYGENHHPSWFPQNDRGHTWNDLVKSDMAQLFFTDATGAQVLAIQLDYLDASSVTPSAPSGYESLCVAGGDGMMLQGSEAMVLGCTSSLARNLNENGPDYAVLTDDTPGSPAIDADYNVLDPAFDRWNFYQVYEVTISADAFGAAGFGGVTTPFAHISPSKVGCNNITVTECVYE